MTPQGRTRGQDPTPLGPSDPLLNPLPTSLHAGSALRRALSAALLAGAWALLAGSPPVAAQEECPTLYRDRDHDGFGSPEADLARVSCDALAGYVGNALDCNDASSRIYPGAPGNFWSSTLGSSDCTLDEPYQGMLLRVGCPVCAEDDPSCRTGRDTCTLPQGCDFDTIQQAIHAAEAGSTIEICQGVYRESIDFMGKPLVVRGRLSQSVILEGEGTGAPAVLFTSGEGPSSVLSNLTLSASTFGEVGGGVFIHNSSPTLEHLHFYGNRLQNRGGAVTVLATVNGTASPLIRRSAFSYNQPLDSGEGKGGAIGVLAVGRNAVSNPRLEDVLLHDNQARSGGGMHLQAVEGGSVSPSLSRVRFFRNRASDEGSALCLESGTGSTHLELSNVILEKNAGGASSLELRARGGTLQATLTNLTAVGEVASRSIVHGDAQLEGRLELQARNSIFAHNQAGTRVILLERNEAKATAYANLAYIDFFNNAALPSAPESLVDETALTAQDPRFRKYDPASVVPGDLALSPGSPAIDGGDPQALYDDASGGRNDLGAYGGPSGTWSPWAPWILRATPREPGADDHINFRRVDYQVYGSAYAAVSCVEPGSTAPTDEAVYFSSESSSSTGLDLLGLRADTLYRCTLVMSNSAGMSTVGFEILTPLLPLELQGLWYQDADSEGAHPGYTLFNVFPASFSPMFAVIVDMRGEVRWYHALYEGTESGYDPEAWTADTALTYLPDRAEILFGGAEQLEALPHTIPIQPSLSGLSPILACASQQDEIQQICGAVEGSTLEPETPNHDAVLSADRTRALYLCSETRPVAGSTPEEYCRDAALRREGFSLEEWDISTPERPVHTWRWSSFAQADACVLPELPEQLDPYHVNGIWLEEPSEGNPTIFVSLRHRNQVLKIDRLTGTLLYKLGALSEEDRCPAAFAASPERCSEVGATAACGGPTFEPFVLVPGPTPSSCPDFSGYEGLEENHPSWFYGQHAPYIERTEGSQQLQLWLHDNGRDAPDNVQDESSRRFSRAVRYEVDEATRAATVAWEYCRGTSPGTPTVWYAPAWGSAYPVLDEAGSSSDHTLVASSHCTTCSRYDDTTSENTFIAEVAADGEVLWSLDLGQFSGVYRAWRIDGCTRLPGRRDSLLGTNVYCGERTLRWPRD